MPGRFNLNKVTNDVVFRTMVDPRWDRTTVLSGALDTEVQTLKSQPGKNMPPAATLRAR